MKPNKLVNPNDYTTENVAGWEQENVAGKVLKYKLQEVRRSPNNAMYPVRE